MKKITNLTVQTMNEVMLFSERHGVKKILEFSRSQQTIYFIDSNDMEDGINVDELAKLCKLWAYQTNNYIIDEDYDIVSVSQKLDLRYFKTEFKTVPIISSNEFIPFDVNRVFDATNWIYNTVNK